MSSSPPWGCDEPPCLLLEDDAVRGHHTRLLRRVGRVARVLRELDHVRRVREHVQALQRGAARRRVIGSGGGVGGEHVRHQ